MNTTISKSQFKPRVLKYLRLVEKRRRPLVITHAGKPVVKVIPYSEDPKKLLASLRGTVLKFEDPTEPVGENDWEALK